MLEINIERPFEAFSQHISSGENQRILFSAPFGSGKTYFLKKYFSSVDSSVKTFWLSPVKYVVSQNEDIFEYIKYDLAFQLLQDDSFKNEIKQKFGIDQYVYQYIKNNPKDIFKLLFSIMEKAPIEIVGVEEPTTKIIGQIGEAGNLFVDVFENYQKYKAVIDKNTQSVSQALTDYLKNTKDIKGSIFEDDIMSQMIRKGISQISEGKISVLIIDDLDRLDPEHIFRILNILSVHQDSVEGQNKFELDKILVVCDYNNIRNIYKHKYGSAVDFAGYIEKFYSTSVFKFTNEQAVSLYCNSELNITLSEKSKKVLGGILAYFIEKEDLTVRSLTKHTLQTKVHNFKLIEGDLNNYIMDTRYKVFDPANGYTNRRFFIDSDDFEVLVVLKILVNIFGNFEDLESKIGKAKSDRNIISPNITTEATMLFAPMQILAENYYKPQQLTVTLQADKDVPQYNPIFVFPPSTTIFNIPVSLQLKWGKSNPYIGEESLYSSDSELISEQSIKNFKESRNVNDFKITYNDFFSALEGFLIFLKNNNFVDKLA